MRKRLKMGIVAAFACLTMGAQAQSLAACEQQMARLFANIEQSTDAQANLRYNDTINALFAQALACDGSFAAPFGRLKFVGKTLSDDGLLRIYTWNVPTNSGFVYNGFVQTATGEYTQFTQSATTFATNEHATLSAENWYGALYYRAIAYRHKRQKVYLLLGWQGANAATQRKFIDVLWFDSDNRLQLGLPILENDEQTLCRRIFEYDADIAMFLDYEPHKRRIAFDHLSPIKYFDDETVTLGPDMSVDAYVRHSKQWKLQQDVRAKNKRK